MKEPRRNGLQTHQTIFTNPRKATRDVQGATKANKGSLHTSHTKVPISREESLPEKLHTIRVALFSTTPGTNDLCRVVHLIDTNKWWSFAPKSPSKRIFSVEGKDIRGIQNPGKSFLPTVTQQLAPGEYFVDYPFSAMGRDLR